MEPRRKRLSQTSVPSTQLLGGEKPGQIEIRVGLVREHEQAIARETLHEKILSRGLRDTKWPNLLWFQ